MYIYKAAVIGAGAMGAGIAQVLTYAGVPVLLRDTSADAVDRGIATIQKIYQGRVEKGKISQDDVAAKMALVTGVTDDMGFSDVDIVIEAIFEHLSAKQELLRALCKICPESMIFASNTSSLLISAIASASPRPDRVIGMHFFNPAPVMKLVEVIPGLETSEEVISDVMAFTESVRKIPIRVEECAGFLVNRLLMPYLNEAALVLQEGATTMEEIDAAMVAFGLPMGPFTLMDMIGIDVCFHVGEILHDAYGPRATPAALIRRLYEEKRYGVKNGAGFYTYDGAPATVLPRLIADIQKITGQAATPFSEARLILPMINEAALALGEGIAARTDIDTAMIAGIGFPMTLRGPLHYADSLGLDHILAELKTLTKTLGPRFWPAPLIVRMVAAGRLGQKTEGGFFK